MNIREIIGQHVIIGISGPTLTPDEKKFIVENNPPAQRQLGIDLSTILETFFFPNGYKVYWIDSKSNRAIFFRKDVSMTRITPANINCYADKAGDFFAEPS